MASVNDLKYLQRTLMLIITEIDAICKKHNITYYLNGGNALGAIRHGGFIPWDDDFDIMMHHSDYIRFLEICKKELDPQKWYIQEAWKDWPGCFSKIRLKGTYLEDIGEWDGIEKENRGIYIDIFEIVNSPKNSLPRRIQYSAAKLLNSYSLLKKGYQTDIFIKKLALIFSNLLRFKVIHKLCQSLVFRYSSKKCDYRGIFFGMSRFKNAFYSKNIFQEPVLHKYEDIYLPLPSLPHAYLEQTFGNYMQLPPIDKQRPAHSLNVDFGNY